MLTSGFRDGLCANRLTLGVLDMYVHVTFTGRPKRLMDFPTRSSKFANYVLEEVPNNTTSCAIYNLQCTCVCESKLLLTHVVIPLEENRAI